MSKQLSIVCDKDSPSEKRKKATNLLSEKRRLLELPIWDLVDEEGFVGVALRVEVRDVYRVHNGNRSLLERDLMGE